MPLAFRRTPQRHVRSTSRAQLLHALTSGSCHCPAASPARPSLPLDQPDHHLPLRHLRLSSSTVHADRSRRPTSPASRRRTDLQRPGRVAHLRTKHDVRLHSKPPPSSPNPAVRQRPRHRTRLPLMVVATVCRGRRRPGYLAPPGAASSPGE